jgi:hypothetical protein
MGRIKMIDWHQHHAAVWRGNSKKLKAVRRLDAVSLDGLKGIDQQKQALEENTEHFVAGKSCNHALLWGARGTGKSSLIKAMLPKFCEQGLRMIQVDKDDLSDLPDILDLLEEIEANFWFVIFCDDLSFDEGDLCYKPLKSLLEGGLELPPANVLFYATSNRRHLMPEKQSENQVSGLVDGEVHYADSLEDKLALSDRFGLALSFYPSNWENYFAIIHALFADMEVDKQKLHEAARLFAMGRGSHSGRTARQFYNEYSASL